MRLFQFTLSVMAVCTVGCTPRAFQDRVPAYWLDGESEAPTVGEYSFCGLGLRDASSGWIVGDRFVLDLQGDRLWMTAIRHPRLCALSVAADGSVWAGGNVITGHGSPGPYDLTVRAVLWRSHGDAWQQVPVPDLGVSSSAIVSLSLDADYRGWAVVRVAQGREPNRLYRIESGVWSLESPLPPAQALQPLAVCRNRSQRTWVVGAQWPADDNLARSVAAVERRGDAWIDHPIGRPVGGGLTHADCPDDGMVAAGSMGSDSGHRVAYVVRQRHDAVESLPLPENLATCSVEALSAVDTDDIWLGLSCGTSPKFAHFTAAGGWLEVAGPELPDGATSKYTLHGLRFTSPGEGWAVASHWRGYVFQYKDGRWRNREWSWHFWDEPWWGLRYYY